MPDAAAGLDELIAMMPFAAGAGIRLEEASAGKVVAVLAWAQRLCTAGGIGTAARS